MIQKTLKMSWKARKNMKQKFYIHCYIIVIHFATT